MTATADKVIETAARDSAGRGGLRAIVWVTHVLVTLLAVFSLCSDGWSLWIDLRALGRAGAAAVEIVWFAAVMLVPCCAGPWMTSWRKPVWVNAGWSGAWARRLLWPTYGVIACLLANTVYYYQLRAADLVEAPPDVPITLAAALFLGVWVYLTRRWTRGVARYPEKSAVKRRGQLAAAAFALFAFLGTGGFFTLHGYAQSPAGPVDLAVVLGNRVMLDGTASPVLRDRTLAAVALYRRGLARHLLLSGDVRPGIGGGPLLDEPLAMFKVCIANGVPATAISLDRHGVNTRATAFDARQFMQAHAMASVVACSDDYHLYRTAASFRELGVPAYTVASVRREWPCTEIFWAVREAAGIAVYQLNSSYRAVKETDMKTHEPRVVVRKAAGMLEIYDRPGPEREEILIKRYACITGGNAGDKAVEGDRRTPVGNFHVVFKNPDSKFHLSLGLDYPSAEDAQRGLKAGLITRAEYEGILAALRSDLSLEENQKKLWYTALGGEIFIHGHAEGRSGTAGCVAVSNPDIEEIYAALPVGTPVEIRP